MISEAYRAQQARLHANPDYGKASQHYAERVAGFMRKHDLTQLLDYGAGKQRLRGALVPLLAPAVLDYRAFDPAFPNIADPPSPASFVACIDVLEHVEPEHLNAVLDDLRRLVLRFGLFTVHTGPALKFLDDGRNAHLTQKPASWWLPLIMERFELVVFVRDNEMAFSVIVEALAGNR